MEESFSVLPPPMPIRIHRQSEGIVRNDEIYEALLSVVCSIKENDSYYSFIFLKNKLKELI